MIQPKLTVVIPIFNRSGEVDRLIENLLSQDMDEAEFLFIDDGSTDDTAMRIRHYLGSDSRLRLITKPNTGTGNTRNLGICQSKGKWLFFLDSDDAIPSSTTLSQLVSLAESEHVQIAGGSTQFEKRGNTLPISRRWSCSKSMSSESIMNTIGDLTQEPFEFFEKEGVFSYSDYQYDAGFSRFIYLRKLLIDNQIQFPRTTFFEDPIFFVRAMDVASQFAVICEPSYIYRIGAHKQRFDIQYIRENIEGFRSNLLFSKGRGYSQLHRITYERFKKFDVVSLTLNRDNYDEIAGLVKSAYKSFDSSFAGVDAATDQPASVIAVNSFGTPEWNNGLARLERFCRLESIKAKNIIKGSALFEKFENSR